MSLNLDVLREVNVRRCEKVFHLLTSWTPADWACAMAGEMGEACNAVKKLKRGDGSIEDVAMELADTIIYADLLAARLGINLGNAIIEKFNKTSKKKNCDIFLTQGYNYEK